MLDHMILTVSNVERSLAFYEAALKPLNIKFFLPYKGEGDHPDLWDLAMARGRSSGSSKGSLILRPFTGGSWPKTMVRSMNSTAQQYPLVPGTIFHGGHSGHSSRERHFRAWSADDCLTLVRSKHQFSIGTASGIGDVFILLYLCPELARLRYKITAKHVSRACRGSDRRARVGRRPLARERKSSPLRCRRGRTRSGD
jgi:hypothetical protein